MYNNSMVLRWAEWREGQDSELLHGTLHTLFNSLNENSYWQRFGRKKERTVPTPQQLHILRHFQNQHLIEFQTTFSPMFNFAFLSKSHPSFFWSWHITAYISKTLLSLQINSYKQGICFHVIRSSATFFPSRYHHTQQYLSFNFDPTKFPFEITISTSTCKQDLNLEQNMAQWVEAYAWTLWLLVTYI